MTSNTVKKYRLLKDWFMPSRTIPAGTIYEEYTPNRSYWNSKYNHFITTTSIGSHGWFEEVKEPIPAKVIISCLQPHDDFREKNGWDAFWYQFRSSHSLKGKPELLIIEAIEKALNPTKPTTDTEEIEGYAKVMWSEEGYLAVRYKGKAYETIKQKSDTEEDKCVFNSEKLNERLEQIEQLEEAFNAGRLTHPLAGFKYDTFRDYCNSKAEGLIELLNTKQSHTNLKEGKEEDKKGWEILTCFDGVNELTVHDFIPTNNKNNSELCLGNIMQCKIHSVKRLKDGEVFTVGDKVNCDKCPESFSHQTIEKFQIADKGFMIASCAGVATSINNISKLPQPEPKDNSKVLHISDDGKEMRKGDKEFIVDVNSFEIVQLPSSEILNDEFRKENKIFSTKEAAENWVVWNKPTHSLASIMAKSLYTGREGSYIFNIEDIKLSSK